MRRKKREEDTVESLHEELHRVWKQFDSVVRENRRLESDLRGVMLRNANLKRMLDRSRSKFLSGSRTVSQLGALPGAILPFEGYLRELLGAKHPPSVYFLIRDEEVIYVGKSKNLWGRIESHRSDKSFDRVLYVPAPEGVDLDTLEAAFIARVKPALNRSPGAPAGRDSAILEALLSSKTKKRPAQ